VAIFKKINSLDAVTELD